MEESKKLEQTAQEYMQWLRDHPDADPAAISEVRSKLASTIQEQYELDIKNFTKQNLNIKNESNDN